MAKQLKDVLKELDSLRGRDVKKLIVTPEQKEFLLKCRDHANPVTYGKMAVLWEELGWGEIAQESLRARYMFAKGKKAK
jgi:hypothetical protein